MKVFASASRLLIFGVFSLIMMISSIHCRADQVFHIAHVGPDKEESTAIKAINLYLEQIHSVGGKPSGLEGKRVELDTYQDNNDKRGAASAAEKIVAEGRAIAVIGHDYSSTSIAAGETYKKAQIPAVSYSATNNKVTQGNDWYFRTIFNDASQGSYLAQYAVDVLNQRSVTVISETLPYGRFLGKVFAETTESLGAESDRLTIDVEQDIAAQVDSILAEIKTKGKDAGLLFLATHGPEAAALIQAFRDAGITNLIMGPDTLSSTSFLERFATFPKEQLNPGYYTNGIYVTAPMNFDAANEEAQQFISQYLAKYGEKPDWSAAYAFDTIKVVVAALGRANNALVGAASKPTIAELRQGVRDQLASMSSLDTAVKGVTGINLFDANGDVDKPVSVARYQDNTAISSMVHYAVVEDPERIFDLTEKLANGRVSKINDRYMYKKSLVYSGVKVNEMKSKDADFIVAELDFSLWFRFRGNFHPGEIEFFNAVSPIELGKPVVEAREGDVKYVLYRAKGDFYTNFQSNHLSLGEHVVGFAFRHRNIDRNSLVYINDTVGMGLTGTENLTSRMTQSLTSEPVRGWKIDLAALFEKSKLVDNLGNPDYLKYGGTHRPFSEYNLALHLKSSGLSLRGIVPAVYSQWISLSCLFVLLLIYILRRKQLVINHSNIEITWVLKTSLILVLLLACEVWVANDWVLQDKFQQQAMVILFDILWWMVPAIIINDAIHVFVWRILERGTGRQVPAVVKGIISTLIYVFALCGVLAFVYDQKLTGLLATSGLIAMIIGLAIQFNLSNVFSGIALNLERPFRVGDWVQIGEHEGEVIDVTWRATKLQTRIKHKICIPNTPVAAAAITNFSANIEGTRQAIDVEIHPGHDPELVRQTLIDAAVAVEKVCKVASPLCFFRGVTNGVAEYTLHITFQNYAERLTVMERVWSNIVKDCKQAGITLVSHQTRIAVSKEFSSTQFDSMK